MFDALACGAVERTTNGEYRARPFCEPLSGMYSATYSPLIALAGTVQEVDCGQLAEPLLLASISPVWAFGGGVLRATPARVFAEPVPLQAGRQAICRAPVPPYQPSR